MIIHNWFMQDRSRVMIVVALEMVIMGMNIDRVMIDVVIDMVMIDVFTDVVTIDGVKNVVIIDVDYNRYRCSDGFVTEMIMKYIVMNIAGMD